MPTEQVSNGIPTEPTRRAAATTNTLANTPTSSLTQTSKPSSTPYPTPAWCPIQTATPIVSGKLRVVYARQGNLWVWDEGKKENQINKDGDVQQISLSDDGQIIAFTRKFGDKNEELWAIHADGSKEHRLVSTDEFKRLDGHPDALRVNPYDLQWEPDSHHLTFFTYSEYHALSVFEPTNPWLVDVDSGSVSAAPYQGGNIEYSPDGKQVVIFNSHALSLAQTDGSNLREDILAPYHGIALGESIFYPLPKWAKDSTSLLVALPDQDVLTASRGTVTVWRVPVKGIPEALSQWTAFAPSVSFSPDLATMAYYVWPYGTTDPRELHIARTDGKAAKNAADVVYTSGELVFRFLGWSPDSQYFLYDMVSPEYKVWTYLGNVCQRPILISESESLLPWNWGDMPAVWVDASRYLLEIGLSSYDDNGELRLGKVGQDQMETLGVVSSYDWAILP
jgi:dipeptidyl aminopeptidase/acylaminoacyl peptidase